MGQPPLGGAQELATEFQRPVGGDDRASGSDSRPTEFAQDYLSRFVGSSPRSRGIYDRSAQSLMLEKRTKASMAIDCCQLPIVGILGSDITFVSTASGKTIGTDLTSLVDVNGNGTVSCGDVARAICLMDPLRETEDQVATREGTDYLNVDHHRDDGEVQVRQLPAALKVPSQFKSIQYDWAAPSANQLAPSPIQQERLHASLKPFIQSMLIGVLVQLRLEPGEALDGDPNGQSIDATIRLNEDLSILLMSAGSVQRSVPIKAIRLVRPPEKCKDSDRCADIRLAGGRFVRFHFDEQPQAKFFGTCMRLLVKAARTNLTTTNGSAPRAA